MIDLNKSREEIDKIDRQIVALFEDRMLIAKDVAEYKLNTGKKVFDKSREDEKLLVLEQLASNEFNKHSVRELFTQIMSMSRKYQYGLLSDSLDSITFDEIDKIDVKENTKIVCFGVKGSYTEQAMEEYFTGARQCLYASTFREVMQAVKDGTAEYGVLPIENTSTGGITDIYDLLVEYDNYIIGEYVVKVDHALLGLLESSVEDIKTVYSHPQALMQCSKYLQNHENMRPVECLSTADSAKKVFEDKDKTCGAIASLRASEYYGLKVLATSINHEQSNSTRFIIITNKPKYMKTANKISICFELPHTSGSLYNMLSHIIFNNLNMTKIESRPLEGRNFEYRFFVDFEGNLQEPGVKNTLFGMEEEAVKLKILGNYKTTQ